MRNQEYWRLSMLFAFALFAATFYLVWGNLAFVPYIVEVRAKTILAIMLSGTALAVATLLFHSVSNNRIITPSSLGLEFLYVLVKTVVVFLFGSAVLARSSAVVQFVFGSMILIAFALLLYRLFLAHGRESVMFLLLVGMVASSLFMTLNDFLGVLMDPVEFQVAQDAMFASFNRVDAAALQVAAVIIVPLSVYAFLLSKKLDVLVLGRDCAVCLGVDYDGLCKKALIITAILVSASTMLAGPMFFFGLLILNLVLQFMPSFRHRALFPAIICMSVSVLMVGQNVVFHVLNFKTELSVIINMIGGVYFFWLVLEVNKKWQLS